MSLPSKWPYLVKSGNTTIPIYYSKTARGYDEFKVVWYDTERKRRFKTISDFEEAKKHAASVNATIANGDIKALTLSNEDRIEYLRARDAVARLGTPLDLAAHEYVEARKLLDAVPLLDAVRDYLKRHPATLKQMSVKELLNELLAAKRKDGLSEEYRKDLSVRLGVFKEAFKCNMSAISTNQINDFLRSLEVGGRSRNNYRRAIGTLIRFAEKKSALAKGALPLEEIDLAKEDQFNIEIFTPKEMEKLLSAAQSNAENLKPGYNKRYASDQGVLPLLVLGGFAGIRTAKEIRRQKWSDINLQTGFIRVTGAKGGTAARRLIPIHENLRRWLAICPRTEETCCTYARPEDALKRLAKRAGVKWKHNALRHSYASYRVAETQSVPQVALELGNSVKMVNKHYRELVTEADAEAWFSIKPTKIDKIIPMPKVA